MDVIHCSLDESHALLNKNILNWEKNKTIGGLGGTLKWCIIDEK